MATQSITIDELHERVRSIEQHAIVAVEAMKAAATEATFLVADDVALFAVLPCDFDDEDAIGWTFLQLAADLGADGMGESPETRLAIEKTLRDARVVLDWVERARVEVTA